VKCYRSYRNSRSIALPVAFSPFRVRLSEGYSKLKLRSSYQAQHDFFPMRRTTNVKEQIIQSKVFPSAYSEYVKSLKLNHLLIHTVSKRMAEGNPVFFF
jgi:hypothetical protein